jgi:hypothetical protein
MDDTFIRVNNNENIHILDKMYVGPNENKRREGGEGQGVMGRKLRGKVGKEKEKGERKEKKRKR